MNFMTMSYNEYVFRPQPKDEVKWRSGEKTLEALPESIQKLFRMAASGNDDPALVASLEKSGRAYDSTIDSKQQFPLCES